MSNLRKEEFQRNTHLEDLLAEINNLLSPVEEELAQQYHMPRYPVAFVVGVPRCGSTLMMQWLAKTGCFAYPTNLLSRFYAAPAVGARIQKLLTDPMYNFRDEILDFSQPIDFQSNLGKTRGALAPNEFWYFWRRFIPNNEPRWLNETEEQQVRNKAFAAALASLEAAFDKPLAMKAIILQLNIPLLSSMLEKALFIYIRRDPLYNAQSLLESRVKYYGNRQDWYSIKPREYERLRQLDPLWQVAGQVVFTSRAIQLGLQQINPDRYLQVDYASFCAKPEQVFHAIQEKLAQQGHPTSWQYTGPATFDNLDHLRITQEERDQIALAVQTFEKEEMA